MARSLTNNDNGGLTTVLANITDITYGILFSEPTMIITENISSVTQALDEIVDLIKMRVREFIVESIQVYHDALAAEYQRILTRVLDSLDERILRTYADLQARVMEIEEAALDEAQRQALHQRLRRPPIFSRPLAGHPAKNQPGQEQPGGGGPPWC